MATSSIRSEFYPGIQALRAIAAMMVVVQHSIVLAHIAYGADYSAVLKMNFGLVGVLMFFCISGFVIGTNRDMPLSEFIGRRVLRIYPAFWAAILIMFLLTPLDISGTVVGIDVKTIFLLPTNQLRAFNIPFWSLIYEVFFYALAALLFSARLSQGSLTIAAILWIFLVHLVAVYSKNVDVFQPGWWMFISRYTQFFAVGLIAAINIDRLRRVGPVIWMAIALGALILSQLVESISVVSQSFFHAVSFASIIVAATDVKRIPAILKRAGDASYGIYLVHWIAILFVIQHAKPAGASLRFTIVASLLTATIAGLAFGLAENRIYKSLAGLIWGSRSRYA